MAMRKVKGGRHNIYLVSLTDKPYTYAQRETEGYILFPSRIASIDCKASRKLHMYNKFVC